MSRLPGRRQRGATEEAELKDDALPSLRDSRPTDVGGYEFELPPISVLIRLRDALLHDRSQRDQMTRK